MDKKNKLIIVAFIITLIFWMVLSFKSNIWPLGNNIGSGQNDSYVISFLASLLEDLIFFGFVGFLVFWSTIKKNSDEPFKVRVKALANNEKVNKLRIESSLEDVIAEALAYCQYVNLLIEIKDYCEKNNCILLSIKIDARIVNMCKDIDYSLRTAYFVEPGEKVNGTYGSIQAMGIYNANDVEDKQVFYENDNYELLEPDIVRKTFNFAIAKNGEAISKTGYTIWVKADKNFSDVDNWYFFQLTRFADEFNLTFRNHTNSNILFKYRVFSSKDNEYKIPPHFDQKSYGPNDTYEELNQPYIKDDRIELNFFKE